MLSLILSVIVLLLKIIGLLLLAILLLLALVLLVPIRYQFIVNKLDGEEPYAYAKINWFIYLFHAKAEFSQGKLIYSAKIFFYQILGNDEEYLKAKEEREKRKSDKLKKKEKQIEEAKEVVEEETILPAEEEAGQESVETELEAQPEEADLPPEKTQEQKYKRKRRYQEKDKKKKKKEKKPKEKKSNPIDKLKAKIDELKAKCEEYHLKENLPFFKDIIVKTLKHILPVKLKGFLTYGFEDPAITGYLTAAAAVFYPKYSKTLQINPRFEEQIIEAGVKGRGRIRLGYLLYIAVLLFMNKDFRKLVLSK